MPSKWLLTFLALTATSTPVASARRKSYTPLDAVGYAATCKYVVESDDNNPFRIPSTLPQVFCATEGSSCGKGYKCTQIYNELQVGWLEKDRIIEKNNVRMRYGCVCALDKWDTIQPNLQPPLQDKKRGKVFVGDNHPRGI